MPRRESRGTLVPVDRVKRSILVLRGQKVLLDADLAVLYGTSTRALNQAVKRNRDRFPADFMFQLTAAEKQEVVTNCDNLAKLKFSPRLPHVFTEHGAVMLAAVLSSPTAVGASILVVRAFVRLRQVLAVHEDLRQKLDEIERKIGDHDAKFVAVFDFIKRLMNEPEHPPKPRIGFETEKLGRKPISRRGSKSAQVACHAS